MIKMHFKFMSVSEFTFKNVFSPQDGICGERNCKIHLTLR